MASLEVLADPAVVLARDEYGRDAFDRAAEAGSAAAVALLIHRGHTMCLTSTASPHSCWQRVPEMAPRWMR